MNSGTGNSSDKHVKRQGYMRLHTMRIHPQPNIHHATTTYQPLRHQDSAAAAAIDEALRRPLQKQILVEDLPLRILLDKLAEQNHVQIVPDMPALADAGLDLDATTVTQQLEGISLRSALRLLLGPPGLTYLVKDEVLLVTTKEKAQENLVVRLYPVAAWSDAPELVETIRSIIAAETWDVVGGAGSIRVLFDANSLAISQTEEIHEDITAFLRRMCDGDVEPPLEGNPTDPAAVATRVYPARDEKTLAELQQKLVPLCNAALGAAGDPEAKVSVVAGRLVVQSRKRSFHVYAAEMIRAIDGVDVTVPEYFGVDGAGSVNSGMNMMGPGAMGGGGGGNPFCWVAREVYGAHDPRWLVFRGWMLAEAPAWLRRLYATVGPDVAPWLHSRPVATAAFRALMDVVVEPRLSAPGPTGRHSFDR